MWDNKRYDHIDQNEDNGEIQTKERYYKVRTCNILETLHDTSTGWVRFYTCINRCSQAQNWTQNFLRHDVMLFYSDMFS